MRWRQIVSSHKAGRLWLAKLRKVLFVAVCLVTPPLCAGQQVAKLSDEVRGLVRVDDPVTALTHVRLIDGTGATAARIRPYLSKVGT